MSGRRALGGLRGQNRLNLCKIKNGKNLMFKPFFDGCGDRT